MAAVGRSGGGGLGGQTHYFGGIRVGQTICRGVGRSSVPACAKPGSSTCQLGPVKRGVPPHTAICDPAVAVENRPELPEAGHSSEPRRSVAFQPTRHRLFSLHIPGKFEGIHSLPYLSRVGAKSWP